MVAATLQSAIENAIRTELAPIIVTRVEITEGKNAFDDDALFVTIHLPSAVAAVSGDRMLATMSAVSDAVVGIGETRFPHVRTQRAGEATSDELAETQH